MLKNLGLYLKYATAVVAAVSLCGCQSALNSYAAATYDPDEVVPWSAETVEYSYSLYSTVSCDVLSLSLDKDKSKQMAEHNNLIRRVMVEKNCGAVAAIETPTVVPSNVAVPDKKSNLAVPPQIRGYLGVNLQKSDSYPKRLASALGLSEVRGVLITGTLAGGAAEQAGLKPLDIVLELDGVKINRVPELTSFVATLPAGHPMKLKVWRNRAELELTAVLSAELTSVKVASGAPGYCYVAVTNPETQGLSWTSTIFPVQESTFSGLQSRGLVVSEQFRTYLKQNVADSQIGPKGYGLCNSTLDAAEKSLQDHYNSQQFYTSIGKYDVTLHWSPQIN
ncbi:S1C family serine protease [Pseudomonas fluorescens]|uniref:S1C family serine protease n=1 Tax=Pseudomonas fluorescens TaxID=294 RepID=UPI001240010C|nr:PDZ domain-containing protein [Pseudomonas fluorescens]VVM74839.1 hypothetical protein PS639_01968 [Pseudomonas fluorescens]